jgi:uncharacterized membrane protein
MRQLLRDQAPHVDLPPQPPTCAATRLKLAQRTPRKASPSKVIVPFIGTLVALCVSIALYSFIGLPSGVVAVAAIAVGVGAGYLAQLYYAIADRRNDTSSS